ncbi:MAG TPA: lytic transglycosylase domain-containing protein, partial [Pyrinomonadaceae bacterium]
SVRHNIDPLLIFAQMSQESSFQKKATSHKGASGLMQLMPATAMRWGVKNIYNPKQNIEAGVKYMRWLLDLFGGDVKLALAAYNAGEGSVKKYGNKIPPYSETVNYVKRITTHYDKIKL